MRCVIVVLLALQLGACAAADTAPTNTATPAPFTGEWKIEKRVDRIMGGPTATAILMSRANNNQVLFSRTTALQLMCFDGKPIVRVGFDIKVGANRSTSVEYRFDEKPGHRAKAKFAPDFKSFTLEEKEEVAQFLNELATSDLLYVRIRSLYLGLTIIEFHVAGAQPGIDAVYPQCPVSPETPHRRTSALPTPVAPM